MSWLTQLVTSTPIRLAASEAATLFIETVATAVALSILQDRAANLKQQKQKEKNDVQLHSKSERPEESNWKNSRLRLVDH